MRHRVLLLYSWAIRVFMYFWPDVPFIMRFRGMLYGLAMKRCGKNFQVAHNVILNSIEGLSVGDNVYIAMNNVLFSHGSISLGNNVMLGPSCTVTSGNHTFLNGSYRYGEPQEEPIEIKDGSWIGANCVILPGVVFPPRSVLAAGAVLSSSIVDKEEGIYGGVPAKLIKKKH